MRPALNPALRPLWRDGQTLQLGLDPQRAVVVQGVHPRLSRFLADLNGRDAWAAAVSRATEFGVPAAEAEHVLTVLRQAGALVDRSSDAAHRDELTTTERDRLAADQAAWTLADRDPSAGTRTSSRRAAAAVSVAGAGRVGAAAARLLAAAGVGRVEVVDTAVTRAVDLSPGGLSPADVGRSRGAQVQQSVLDLHPSMGSSLARRPSRREGPRRGGSRAGTTLTLLCPVDPLPDRDVVEQQVARGTAHLSATVIENVGTVGPLVLPGASPCLRCLDLHRADRDPQWPLLVAQLTGRPPVGFVAPSDVALAAAVSAHAALAVLRYIDAPAAPHTLSGALLEFRPGGQPPGRRTFDAHPSCGCRWADPESVGQLRPATATMGR